jgi:hypothetical protein
MIEGVPVFDDPLRIEGCLFKYVLVNNNQRHRIPPDMSHLTPVQIGKKPAGSGYKIVGADVIDEAYPWRHDATKLAEQLMYWYKKVVQT